MKRLVILLFAALLLGACNGHGPKVTHDELSRVDSLVREADPAVAHLELKKISERFHREGNYDLESACLALMGSNYLNQWDTIGLKNVLDQMEALWLANPAKPGVGYSYYSVLETFYAVKYQDEPRGEDRDSMESNASRAIALLEQMTPDQWQEYRINPVWNYYNRAVEFDLMYDEPQTDSIEYYLDKARVANETTAHLDKNKRWQGDISIKDMQAWLYYYDGQYARAEKEMLEVLALVDSVEAVAPNEVLTEKGEAYAFFVELYSNTGKPQEALRYQQLKNENDLVRLSAERNAAVRKVEAQYNVARAETKVARLRTGLILAGGLVLLLALSTIVLLLWRRNRLQMQYSAAVEALVETDEEVRSITERISVDRANKLFAAAEKPLSAVERKYILLFLSGRTTEEIAAAMHVEPSSVYTMKYRIKKKFSDTFPLPF